VAGGACPGVFCENSVSKCKHGRDWRDARGGTPCRVAERSGAMEAEAGTPESP